MKAILFNGKDGTKISTLEGHKGGIYGVRELEVALAQGSGRGSRAWQSCGWVDFIWKDI